MFQLKALLSLGTLFPLLVSGYNIALDSTKTGLAVTDGKNVLVHNSAILSGNQNTTTTSISLTTGNSNSTKLTYQMLTPTIAKIQLNSTSPFLGARFTSPPNDHFYGIWEYPWSSSITNLNITHDLKGIGNSPGTNWCSARAPFFLSSAGYAVYTDTLAMGSYNFTSPGNVQFIFNSSSLVYYIILPTTAGDFKSIIEQYTALSARSEMPPTSGFGPTFWSDDFTQDFHGGVSNAQENFGDVVDHLYYNKIHATAMFADRPYGTGNRSFGNFDFNPTFYPTPSQFIQNLTTWGYDFQIWIANRAFLNTELYNTSVANSWLFPGIDPVQFLGPALNLSIPEAYAYFKKRLAVFPAMGVKGYKIDRGEEEEMPVWEQNTQMTLFLQLAYETMREVFGAGKFYNFARSAVDRSRARTAIWNGDSHANFTGLAYSVASGIRSGLISFPIWGSDTGGYVRDSSDTSNGEFAPTPEVWGRWMWFSAFSPVYEIMIGMGHTPWYAPYGNETVGVLKRTTGLHHLLLPYIKSYALEASKSGVPIMRALFLEAPTDKKSVVWQSNDEYFFGREFLVAPIVTTGNSRSVYFPRTRGNATSEKYLYYFDKKTVYTAGSTVNVSASMEEMPVYVVQGAIVPVGDVYQGNNKWTEDWKPSLTVEIYPSAYVRESEFRYFGGEGAEGDEALIRVRTDREGGVRVQYEDLGVEGKVVVYLKGGTKEFELSEGGDEIEIEDAEFLF